MKTREDVSASLSDAGVDRALAGALALAGAGIAIDLSLYQYGIVPQVWEPFFGAGSAVVLHYGLLDAVSRVVGLPLHDAPLGAIAYLIEASLAFSGRAAARRWASSWTGVAYALVVLSLSLGSVGLVLVQGFVLHAWCTLCLSSAILSEIVLVVSRHEIVTAYKFLTTRRSHGSPMPAAPTT